MSQDVRYALASVEHASELSRLEKLQAINDPATLAPPQGIQEDAPDG